MKKSIPRLCAALAASLILSGLVGCAPLLVSGAFVGGTLVATDRRTSGAQLEDEGIEFRAAARLRETFGERVHININSYNRQVLVTGEVPTEQDKATAEQIVSKVENIKSVLNELAVLGNSTVTARSSDTLVTARVKSALVNDKEIYSNAFKIVTERGTVYIMGRVTKREADLATNLVRSVSGVQKVVRVIELISEDELKRLVPEPAPAVEMKATPVMSGSGQPVMSGSPK